MTQRMLAIDDEIHILKLIERIISEKTPYQITITNNPLEVEKILSENQFDLIVTDLKMPGLDGMDILQMVKEKERFEQVVIMTAFGSLESALEALSYGVFDYITKPFKKEQLIHTVDRAMKWQKSRKELNRMDKIFDTHPFSQSILVFKREYLRRLAEKTDNDPKLMVEKSGLTPHEIEDAFRQDD